MRSSKEEATMEVSTERSLHLLPPTYAPSLVFFHGKKYCHQTFYTLSDGCYHVRSIPEMRRMRCVASYYGWLILQSCFSSECYLFNPVTLTKIYLPPLIHSAFNIGVLTSSPSDPKCVIMFFSGKKRSCIFCRIGDTKWIEQVVGRKKKTDILIRGDISAISCKGKIYLFFCAGMAIIDAHDTFVSIETHEMGCLDLSTPGTKGCCSNFVESCDDIFLVAEVFLGFSNRIVQTLDVFKLDQSTMVWVKVESLGDRIFLLGKSSTSFSATELGVKGNCIFFCPTGYTSLCRFDMDDGTITTSLPFPNKISQWRGPFWVVPNCKLQVKKEVAKVQDIKNAVNEEQGYWKDLPTELWRLIFESVFLGDCVRFRLACKTWMSITPPLRSFHRQPKCDSQNLPWLISFPKYKKGVCFFYHPIYTDAYIMNFPELAGAIVRHAKFGWLLMSQGERSIFFFNPFTKETIKLPNPEMSCYNFVNISFSSPPTSSECIVFGHKECHPDMVHMLVYRKGEDIWSEILAVGPYTFLPSHCNPVFRDGVFYSLSKDGKLGVFSPNETEDDDIWRVVPNVVVPNFSSSSSLTLLSNFVRNFITEYDGEILSVFVGFVGKPICVYKLDRSKTEMKWVRVESLGENVMFLSDTTSILIPAGLKGIEDRIYVPRFKGEKSMFFSLRSGSYQCFGDKNSRADWMDTCEHWNCTWFMSE